jgi:signal transduction histidine kinase
MSLDSSPPPFAALQHSIAVQTLVKMAFSLVLVIIVISGISYWHLMRELDLDTRTQLLGYIAERGQREESIFNLAQDNHGLLRAEFLREFYALDHQTPVSLDRLVPWSDGTKRNAPEGIDPTTFDTVHEPTVFVQPGVEMTADVQQRLALSWDLVRRYGAAWRDRFLNTYISLPEGTMTVLWPGAAWGINADPHLNFQTEEWFYLGDRAHNPQRRTLWTGIYADPVTQDWMVSAETPIDDAAGHHLATIGHDIVLTQLIDRVIADHLDGAYNLLIRADGQIMVDPDLTDRIQAADGRLTVQTAGDAHLSRLFALIQQTSDQHRVVYNPEDHEYLAIARLAGIDWDLVTVYPEILIRSQALHTTWFILGLGLIALGLECLLLFTILQYNVERPLQSLLSATQQVTQRTFDVSLDTERPDEWGQLAIAFTQMAHQLQTAFTTLGQKVMEQEQDQRIILEKSHALEDAFQELQQMQLQTVQSEKMSALGNLVAGVAHEINNPVGFLKGNIKPAQDYVQDLFELLDLYNQKFPVPDEEIEDKIEEIDLDFVRSDLLQLLNSMHLGVERIQMISNSLRIFSREDQEYKIAFDIHQGLDSTVLILKHRTKANELRPTIEVEKHYGQIPEIQCFSGQLNQVFMNILANAIDALDESNQGKTYQEIEQNRNRITIQTALVAEQVQIQIQDNGCGMPPEIADRIFEQGFTTKAVGKGTGLGMAIAHQIITEKHGGAIACTSTPNEGTTFTITLPLIP